MFHYLNKMTNVTPDCETTELILGARFVEVSSDFSLGKDFKACAFTFNYEIHRLNMILTEMLYYP